MTKKIICPSCGCECKYGYIEPVKRDEVLDEAINAVINTGISIHKNTDKIDGFMECKKKSIAVIAAIKALKETE